MPGLSALLLMLAAAGVADPHPAALVGRYDGGQMEMAVGLELRGDGRFRYGLSYGALDEEASGTWRADKGGVVLDSDPVKAPHFAFVGQASAPAQTVHVDLDVPEGMDRQLFESAVNLADGTAIGGQLSDQGLSLLLKAGQRPTTVRVALPMFEIVSDPVTIDPAKGLGFRFRFEANDLGKADFRGTLLANDGGVLVLNRFDRTIRFKRVEK